MFKIKIGILAIILFLVMGCSDDNMLTEPMDDDNMPPDMVDTTMTGGEQYLSLTSDYIFDQNKLHTFELNLSESALAEIDSDPAAEEYVEGSLSFEGETIGPIGIRYKGSIGAFVNCLSNTDWSNPSGYKTCTKLSMKIKINWEGSDRKFYGLKKLQFHSLNNDPSQMRERLGYWLFREMGVPAPRAVHARLIINGTYHGVYALVEQIDGRFTRYNFEDGEGNLYKEIWPLNYNNQPFSEQQYIDHLKTNEDENPSAELIRTFAQEVVDANPDELQTVINKWMNIQEILSYAVVDRTIRHDDGPFHWYCSGGGCESHNFYWYEDPTEQKMHLIPWDLDHAFMNIIFDANPVTPIADDWGETTANCAPFGYGLFQLQQRSAACDKLTGGWASYEEEYAELKTQLITGPLSSGQANVNLDKWIDQIRTATEEAKQTHSDAISISQWENEITQLRSQIQYARDN